MPVLAAYRPKMHLAGVSYSAEALAFFARLVTPPSTARKALYDTMIRALVAAGVWAKLDALYIYAAADQATALTNLISASYGGTAVNAPTFAADVGFTGNGSTSYIANGITANALAQFQRNSASLFMWIYAHGANEISELGQITTDGLRLRGLLTGSGAAARVNDAATLFAAAETTGVGSFSINRSGASARQLYRGATSAANDTQASAAVAAEDIAVLKTVGSFSNSTISAAAIGGSHDATETAARHNAVHTYLQAVAGVP